MVLFRFVLWFEASFVTPRYTGLAEPEVPVAPSTLRLTTRVLAVCRCSWRRRHSQDDCGRTLTLDRLADRNRLATAQQLGAFRSRR